MAKQRYINNFDAQLAYAVKAGPSTGDPDNELDYGILRVNTGASAYMPQLVDGDYYVITAYKKSGSIESNIEVMRVTSTDNSVVNEFRLYVQRGQEGTMPQTYDAGDYIGMRFTAGSATRLIQENDTRIPLGVADALALKVHVAQGKDLSTNDYTTADKDKLAGVAVQATKNATDAQLRDRATHTGVQPISSVTGLQASLDVKVDKAAGKDLSTNDYSAAEKTKLAGISVGATANAADSELRDRATHTGMQAISTVQGLQAALDELAAAQSVLEPIEVGSAVGSVGAGQHALIRSVSAATVTAPGTPSRGDRFRVTAMNGLETNSISWNGRMHCGSSEAITVLDSAFATCEWMYLFPEYGWVRVG